MYPLFHLPRKKHSVYLNQYPKIHMEVGKKQNFICENSKNREMRGSRGNLTRCIRDLRTIFRRSFENRRGKSGAYVEAK